MLEHDVNSTITLKSPEQRGQEKLRTSVDRLVALKQAIDHLKQEKDALESELLLRGTEDLKDTKLKTVRYYGDTGRVSVTMAKKLEVKFDSNLEQVFGPAYPDVVKEKLVREVTAPAARMLSGICKDEYIKMSVSEVINQLPADERTKAALRKKLRGINYLTDKKNLMDVGGFDEDSAEGYAYFVTEAAVWEEFRRIASLNGLRTEKEEQALLEQIRNICSVAEIAKIAVEATEE